MEQFEQIYTNIKTFLSRQFNIENFNDIELSFEKLNGLSNDIYLVKIFNQTAGEMIDEIIYRKFGQISDLVNRELEETIISNLAQNGYGPKILQTDSKTYRIEEYVTDSSSLQRSVLKESEIIDRIMEILVSYTLVSCVYSYKIHCDAFSAEYTINVDPNVNSQSVRNPMRITQTMFNMCMKDMYLKAKSNFEKFSGTFKKKYNRLINTEIYAKFDKIKAFIKNYNEVFLKIFPKKGFFALNHNDVHRLNLLLKNNNEKLMILDHEYAALNLVGIDIVNYLIETNFDYTLKEFPFYEFTPDDIDFQAYFKIFSEFIQKFEDAHSYLFETEEKRKEFENVKTFKYFLRLVCVISLFWLLYSVIYFDFNSLLDKGAFDYFQHAHDRIIIMEKAYKELVTLEI